VKKVTVFKRLPQGQDLAFVFRPEKGGTAEEVTLRLPSTRITPTTYKHISREDLFRVTGSGCPPAAALRPEQTARHAAAIAAFADALRKAAEHATDTMNRASDAGGHSSRVSAELLGIRVSGRTLVSKDWLCLQDVVVVDMPLEPKGQYQRIEVNDFAIRDTHVLTERNWAQYISDYLSRRGVSTRLRYFTDGQCDAELTLGGVAIQGVKAETGSPDGTMDERPHVPRTHPGRLELTASVPGTWASEPSAFKERVSRYTVFEIRPVAGDLALLFVPDKDGKAEEVRVSLPPDRRNKIGWFYVPKIDVDTRFTASGVSAMPTGARLSVEERRQAAIVTALLDALRQVVEKGCGARVHSETRVEAHRVIADGLVYTVSGSPVGIRLTSKSIFSDYRRVYDKIIADIPLDGSGKYERLTVQDGEFLEAKELNERDWARYLTELLQRHGARVTSRFAEDILCEVTLTFHGIIMLSTPGSR